MVRRSPRGAWPQIGRGSVRALAADVIRRRLADLAFCEPGHSDGNPIGNPMNYTQSTPAFRVHHGESEALRSCRRIGPRQRRRNVLTDAVRIVFPIAGVLLRQRHATKILNPIASTLFAPLRALGGMFKTFRPTNLLDPLEGNFRPRKGYTGRHLPKTITENQIVKLFVFWHQGCSYLTNRGEL